MGQKDGDAAAAETSKSADAVPIPLPTPRRRRESAFLGRPRSGADAAFAKKDLKIQNVFPAT